MSEQATQIVELSASERLARYVIEHEAKSIAENATEYLIEKLTREYNLACKVCEWGSSGYSQLWIRMIYTDPRKAGYGAAEETTQQNGSFVFTGRPKFYSLGVRDMQDARLVFSIDHQAAYSRNLDEIHACLTEPAKTEGVNTI